MLAVLAAREGWIPKYQSIGKICGWIPKYRRQAGMEVSVNIRIYLKDKVQAGIAGTTKLQKYHREIFLSIGSDCG